MKYTKTVDVWELNDQERSKLQVGQWVSAGKNGNKGVWCGMNSNGIALVTWLGNISRRAHSHRTTKRLIANAKSN